MIHSRRNFLTSGVIALMGLAGCGATTSNDEGVLIREFAVVNRDTEEARIFEVEIAENNEVIYESSYEVPKRDSSEWPAQQIEFNFPNEPSDLTINVSAAGEEVNSNFIEKGYDGECLRAFCVFSTVSDSIVLNMYEREMNC